jgi:[ribosomal protein S18]-alanine N-acetyltransferase
VNTVPMSVAHLDEVLSLEARSYAFPWTRGNFVDSLAAGHWCRIWRSGSDPMIDGYAIAMAGVDELHLLNLTVAPHARRAGLGTRILDATLDEARRQRAAAVWLEVRGSNEPALALYARHGFTLRGTRRNYYPAARGAREDALMFALDLEPQPLARPLSRTSDSTDAMSASTAKVDRAT